MQQLLEILCRNLYRESKHRSYSRDVNIEEKSEVRCRMYACMSVIARRSIQVHLELMALQSNSTLASEPAEAGGAALLTVRPDFAGHSVFKEPLNLLMCSRLVSKRTWHLLDV